MKTVLEESHREYRRFEVDGTGAHSVLPVVVTQHGILLDFARYMFLRRMKSRSWQDSATFAIRLLLEYMEKNHNFFDSPRALFNAFSTALFTGTIENYRDPSGLWWEARDPEEARKLINQITQFSDWLSAINENSHLQLNPWRQATRHEQRLNWAAYSHRRDNAFLSHLWRVNPTAEISRSTHVPFLPTERQTPVKTFPDEKFNQLVAEGFRRCARNTRGQQDLRSILVAYLMHYGGLRLSEALSLWSEDVSVEAGEVIVRVHHPQHGKAHDNTNRSAYLQKHYGLKPRNVLVKATDPLFLGWKNALITDPQRRCFEVFFYPYDIGQIFAVLWRDYHLMQRVKPKAGEGHPYAFTNKYGQPYTHRMFRKAHKLAVERIGLEYGKLQGTTPHGHRHAYGQRMTQDGAAPLLLKNAMHHASITSSEVYTQPTSAQVRQSLRDVEARLTLQHPISNPLTQSA